MQREVLDVDVLIVGGGPAGLSAALRLAQLQRASGDVPLVIAVLEKARDAGAHSLSGAVMDPSALMALIPDFRAKQAPIGVPVGEEHVYFLTHGLALPFPIVPPPLRNHGNFIVSLQALVRWLAAQVEAAGVDLFVGFAGQDVLMDDARVVGVRTGDRGVARSGARTPQFEPGVDITAKVTIFCDGVRGNLTKQVLRRLPLARGREPEQFVLGLKELWELPDDRLATGTVMHTLGYPLTRKEYGGGFVYATGGRQISVGFVAGLDYHDPRFDPHTAFNRFKQHPLIAGLLRGGEMLRFGAKAAPEGGWNSIPQPYMDGALIAGDAAGFLDSMRLKGIHLAMHTGMLAAEATFDALKAGDTSAARLRSYQDRIDASAVRAELYPVRNVHQAFGHGLYVGLAFSAAMIATGGRWFGDLDGRAGHERMEMLPGQATRPVASEPVSDTTIPDEMIDQTITFDKVTDVHYSGTSHREDQPSHLLVHTEVCSTICGPEYGHPCTRFCPAHVYEITREADGTARLQINASNCVHCKTCDIMDPYQVITWVPPEGGGGPQYNGM